MRSGLPGGPIVEHVGNAPSPLMGIGAALMFVGLFLTMALSAAENNQVLTYIGIGGVITMIVGIAFTSALATPCSSVAGKRRMSNEATRSHRPLVAFSYKN